MSSQRAAVRARYRVSVPAGDICCGIDVVVVDCGGHWEPVLPFVLLHIGGKMEELFYPLVFSF